MRKWEKKRKEERELGERERESGVFPAHMSFRHPDNLNPWNSLNSSIFGRCHVDILHPV